MIEFKPVRLEDRTDHRALYHAFGHPATATSPSPTCTAGRRCSTARGPRSTDSWSSASRSTAARRIGYMQPVGEGDLRAIIPALREDAHAHGQRLRIIGLTDEGRETIRQTCTRAFSHSNRTARWKITSTTPTTCATSPGRRYQPKRNHINRFMAEYPDYPLRRV